MINLGNMSIADLRLGASQVKAAYFGSEQIWGGEEPVPVGDWLCFTAEEANSTVKLYKHKTGAPTLDIETSTDGSNWTAYTQGTVLTAANVGDKVYFRAGSTGNPTISNTNNTNRFALTGKMAASGDLQYLLSQDGTTQPTGAWCFNCLFQYQTGLTEPPKCGATTLGTECYGGTFEGCSNLRHAPELNATNFVGQKVYINMFVNCTSLTTAPKLPATTLTTYCYNGMFDGCTSLSSVEVEFTTWTPNTSINWLRNVAASGTFTCPAELPDTRDASHIPTGWNVVHPAAYPMQDLKLHFDAIDNAGVGSHLSSTQDWANIAPDTSADYKMRRTTGTWEDDSAVFTGAYNECFWLQDIGGTQINNLFSSLNMLSSSWTYAIGLYYDPATIANYRGYIGQQQSYTNYAQIYLRTDQQISWLLFGYKQGGASTGSQDSYFEGHAPNFKDLFTQNAFNTMVGTWDAATATFKVYVNGQLEFTWQSPGGAVVLEHELPLTLGGGQQQSGSNRTCKGKIHDFLVYSRALSDVEVAQLHDYQAARFNS